MQTITVPETATVSVRKGARTISGIRDWPLASLEKVLQYGFQQLANDAAAPAKKTWTKGQTPTEAQTKAYDAEVDALVDKRIANLAAGIMRASSVRIGDPVAAEALRIATARVNAALKKASREATAAEVRKLAVELIAKRPEITDVAKANVAAASGLDIEVDLSDLD
jgi:hypothetical protein